MFYCPNCASIVKEEASSCVKCHADFGSLSSWKPTKSKPKIKKAKKVFKEIEHTPTETFFIRIVGTLWLSLLVFLIGDFVVTKIAADYQSSWYLFAAYLIFNLYASVRLWLEKPFPAAFLIAAASPIFFSFLIPILVIFALTFGR